MSNFLTWKQAKSGNWWLAQTFPGSVCWHGICLVFRRDSESPWTASLADHPNPKPVRDTPCASLREAARMAEEWAEARGYRIDERFPAEKGANE